MSLVNQASPISVGKVSRFETLRSRLLVAFTAVAILPILAITFISAISGAQSSQLEAFAQLDEVMKFKETSIKSWVDALQADLNSYAIGETLVKQIEELATSTVAPSDDPELQETYNTLRRQYQFQVARSQYFDEFILLKPSGQVIFTTSPGIEGQIFSGTNLLRYGLQGPSVDASSFFEHGRTAVFAAHPVVNQQNKVVAVLIGRAKILLLNNILQDPTGLGETGVSYLVRLSNQTLMTGLDLSDQGVFVDSESAHMASLGTLSGSMAYDNFRGIPVFGLYRQIPYLQAALILEQDQVETNRTIYASLAVTGSVAISSLIVAIFLAVLVTRTIAGPVSNLAETAGKIASGEREFEAEIERMDEVGQLAQAFNSMTQQLRNLIESLEQRVADRTRDLEKRSNYLEASSQVSQAAASILEPERLLGDAVELIRERFDLYYVGIFMVDEQHQWATLEAGTGEAGKAMIARGHRLQISPTSMIGWCITNSQARVAQVATTDEVRVATPELPETRSEAAFPLRSRGQVIGAITVQSTLPNAFDQTAIAILQTMADQLATSIDNARLFLESKQALEAVQRAYSFQTQTAWSTWLETQPFISFRAGPQGVSKSEPIWYPEMEQAKQQLQVVHTYNGEVPELNSELETDDHLDGHLNALAVPIQIRGNVIGVLGTRKAGTQNRWTEQEIAFLQSVAEQVGVALDSARLYQETRRRAERERLIREITTRMRESNDPKSILQTAVSDLRRALQADLAQILLKNNIAQVEETYSEAHDLAPEK